MTMHHNESRILAIENGPRRDVVDIQTSTGTFFAGGLATHNCFVKRGGCGTKFPDGDAAIESQAVGRIHNPDIADVVNTVQKMAQKRSLVAATLLAVNASEFFTQDIEDAPHVKSAAAVEGSPVEELRATVTNTSRTEAASEPSAARSAAAIRTEFERKAAEQFGIAERGALAKLALRLLGRKPERWTAQVWQEIMEKPHAAWQAAAVTRRPGDSL